MTKTNFLHRTWLWIKYAFYSIFAGGDAVIKQETTDDEFDIISEINVGGVLDDLLQGKETKQVQEFRDEYYRVLEEAQNYQIKIDGDSLFGESDGPVKYKVTKMGKLAKGKHAPVDESDGYPLRVIQVNKQIELGMDFQKELFAKRGLNPFDYETIISINWDGRSPMFRLDKMCKRAVVKSMSNGKVIIDLYFAQDPGRYDKTSALLIKHLYDLLLAFGKNEDLQQGKFLFAQFDSLWFYADKAWNAYDMDYFEYNNVKLAGIKTYDGNFVVRYTADIVADGDNIAKKYKTKELDEKIANKTPRNGAVDIFAIDRMITKEKEEKNENSN